LPRLWKWRQLGRRCATSCTQLHLLPCAYLRYLTHAFALLTTALDLLWLKLPLLILWLSTMRAPGPLACCFLWCYQKSVTQKSTLLAQIAGLVSSVAGLITHSGFTDNGSVNAVPLADGSVLATSGRFHIHVSFYIQGFHYMLMLYRKEHSGHCC
jgi:hypothetical protein